MAVERTYTIPLRREWLKAPKYKRAKRAVNAVRAFLKRHLKADEENIKLGKYLNLELWKHGIKNPPGRIKVIVTKDDAGKVVAELSSAPKEKSKTAEKKEGKKTEARPPAAPEEKKAVQEKPAAEKKAESPEKKPVSEKAPKSPPSPKTLEGKENIIKQ